MTGGRPDFLGGLHQDRLRRLLNEVITKFELDLYGATVLTEAASNAYAVTPVIAAMAGARVVALTRDARYATTHEVMRQLAVLNDLVGLPHNRITVSNDRDVDIGAVDIVTNLGFVRPIDRKLLMRLSPSGVVSAMCEAWEVRPSDIDHVSCRELGVPVAGVSEDFQGLDVFRSTDQLAVKMCFEAGLEVAGNRITLIS